MVGGDDDQRVVPDSRLAHPRDDLAQDRIDVADLQQVALIVARHRTRVGSPVAASRQAGDMGAQGEALARRQVLPRLVGQQHVQEVERRLPAAAEPLDEPVHEPAAVVSPLFAPVVLKRRLLHRREVGPRLRHRRERPGQIVRQDHL